MTEVNKASNASPQSDYQNFGTSASPNLSNSSTSSSVAQAQDISIQDALNSDPELKASYERVMRIAQDTVKHPSTVSVYALISALIKLSEAMQKMATAYAARLTNLTQTMDNYSKQISSIPVITADMCPDVKQERINNANAANSITRDVVSSHRSKIEDIAKKVQNLLQQGKDANSSINDLITSLIDLIRGLMNRLRMS